MMPMERIKMVDINGNLHSLSKLQVRVIMIIIMIMNMIIIDFTTNIFS